MSSLLFVGVLGGLMVPLPSEAVPPTIKVAIDGVQVAPVAATAVAAAVPSILIATNSTCTAAEGTGIGGLGYTHCYAIRTSTTRTYPGTNGRLWKIQTVSGLTARLRIADQAGQDKFSLVGIRFVPVPWTTSPQTATAEQNTNEAHVITITMANEFNSPLNVGNAASIATDGGYIWALRIGGEFSAGPAGSNCNFVQGDNLCDAVGDRVEYTGTGIFSGTARVNILSPSAQNSQPLSFTVAGPHADPILSFAGITNTDMGQVDPTYPRFNCAKAGAETTCQPDVTQIITVTLKGPDTFVLVGGGDGNGAKCQISQADQDALNKDIKILTKIVNLLNWWEGLHHNATLRAIIDNLQRILDAANQPPSDSNCPGATLIKVAQAIQQASDQFAFILHNAVPAVPVPPGTITINKHLNLSCDGLCAPVPFTFSIRNTGDNSIVASPIVTTDGTGNGSTVLSLPDGTYNVNESPQSGWNLTTAFCNDGENINGVIVSAGGNVTCYFTNSPATSNDLGIRLTWGALPTDLDSHLFIPNGNEVAYFSQGSLVVVPYAELDLDDVTGLGPENVTVVRWMKGTYQYLVHNYSNSFNPGMTGSPALVELIRNGVTTSHVPPAGEGSNRYWHVFNVVVDEACEVSIVPINAWLTSPSPPAPITAAVCPDN